MEISIAPFQLQDQAAAKQLVLDGLVDHWGWLDPTKNPDLDNIAATYANATFLVARRENEIIGCGTLIPRSTEHCEIARMSVRKSERGRGIGKLILNALCDAARAQGFQRIILETTATWTEVIAFYQHNGFRITHYQEGDVYFEKWLLSNEQ